MKYLKLIFAVLLAITALSLSSCKSGGNKKEANASSDKVVESMAVETESETPENNNPFFNPYPEKRDLVEANSEVMPDSLSQEVYLGKKHGKVLLILKKQDGGIVPFIKYRDVEHNIANECGLPGQVYTATLAAWDLDHDGNKEILFHTGDAFALYILAMTDSKECLLEHLGCLSNNWEFFVTSDGVIVSMMGSQGGAEMARLRGGKLERLEQDFVDKLLIGSEGYHELEYIFDDNSNECREYEPLLKTDRYIICKGGEMYGDHVMDVDLNRDGRKEQLYMGNPGWGATSFDIVRVNSRKQSYPMVSQMYEDTIIFRHRNYDCVVKDYLQLSAVDVDSDGKLEIVATGGTLSKNSTYVMRYAKDSLVLVKNFVKDGPVTEADLRN